MRPSLKRRFHVRRILQLVRVAPEIYRPPHKRPSIPKDPAVVPQRREPELKIKHAEDLDEGSGMGLSCQQCRQAAGSSGTSARTSTSTGTDSTAIGASRTIRSAVELGGDVPFFDRDHNEVGTVFPGRFEYAIHGFAFR